MTNVILNEVKDPVKQRIKFFDWILRHCIPQNDEGRKND